MRRSALPRVLDVPAMALPVTVVGDVHLTAEAPEVARRFVDYLGTIEARGGTLVILGDLFDWWVGRTQARRSAFARSILDALSRVQARGVRLTFVAGNRDYAFDGADGLEMEIWPDVVRTRWGERTVVLSHGDLLCSADRAYLRLRTFLRWAPSRIFLRSVPYGFQRYLARGLRSVSTRSVRRRDRMHLGIDYRLAREWLDGYEADALVVGHVHTGVRHRTRDGTNRDTYVLKDWAREGSEVLFDGSRITLRRV